MDPPIKVFGYVRCNTCGVTILESQANQTNGFCVQCWKDRSPLATLEVMNQAVRSSTTRSRTRKKGGYTDRRKEAPDRRALLAAWRRLGNLFPEILEMLVDEERTARGLHPKAHFDPMETDEIVSKTLAFHDVYDALDSEGVSDA